MDDRLERRLRRRRRSSLPSAANWIIDTGHGYPGGPGNWGTGEIQNYTNSPNNLSLDGTGNLRITPRRDGAGNWTSARIETQRSNFKPPAGGVLAIEGRIQMPNVTGDAALGYWPAFWALGAPYRGNYWNWPGIGEFDIMENVNGINSVWGVLHCGVNPGGPCNETSGIANSRACPGATCQAGVPHVPLRVGHEHLAEPVALVRRRPAVPLDQPGTAAGRHVERT